MQRFQKGFGDKRRVCNKINVSSTCRGSGATHLSMLMAGYYAKVKRVKTAVVDLGSEDDYLTIHKVLGKEMSDHVLKIGRIDIYPKVLRMDLEVILAKDYGCVILDTGDNYFKYKNEAAMCDRRFLVMNLSLWKLENASAVYREYFINDKGDKWKYVFSFGDEESAMYMQEQFGIRMHRIPFVPDSFRIARKQFETVERLILED